MKTWTTETPLNQLMERSDFIAPLGCKVLGGKGHEDTTWLILLVSCLVWQSL